MSKQSVHGLLIQWSVSVIKFKDVTRANCFCVIWFVFASMQPAQANEAILSRYFPVNNGSLPDWISYNRIHGHVGLFNQTGDTELAPEFVQDVLDDLGVGPYTRHVKVDWRYPIWPSEVPEAIHRGDNKNFLSPIILEAEQSDSELIAYYWFAAEGRPLNDDLAKGLRKTRFPVFSNEYDWSPPRDWYCESLSGELVDASSKGASSKRGYHLDITSEYREFVLQRLQELANQGVRAFYFDGLHLPRAEGHGCFGSNIERQFLRAGEVLPDSEDASDSQYIKFLNFQADKLAETFRYWNEKINENLSAQRKVVFIVSGTYLSSYLQPNMNLALGASSDILKVEYSHGLKWAINGKIFRNSSIAKPSDGTIISLGWILPRDASASKVVHVWTPYIGSIEEMRSYIATTQSYGAMTALHISPSIFTKKGVENNHRSTRAEVLREGFKFGDLFSGLLASTHPIGEVALLVSERFAKELGGIEKRWSSQMALVNWSYEILNKLGVASRTINEYDVAKGNLSDYAAIVVPQGSFTASEMNQLKLKYSSVVFLELDSTSVAYKAGFKAPYDKLYNQLKAIADERAGVRVVFPESVSKYWPHYLSLIHI